VKKLIVIAFISFLPLTLAREVFAYNSNTQIVAELITDEQFEKVFSVGSTYCFSDRGVDYNVRIDGFSFNHQLVEFTYLDGAFQGSRGSSSYSVFVSNPC
jgi:hypothetical protein